VLTSLLVINDSLAGKEVICQTLLDHGYCLKTAETADEALRYLEEEPEHFSALLAGIELLDKPEGSTLNRIQESTNLKTLPFIWKVQNEQPANQAAPNNGHEYIIQDDSDTHLLSVVHDAAHDAEHCRQLQKHQLDRERIANMIRSARYQFQTIQEAQILAKHLASAYSSPERILIGLSELLMNAVEHGNLAINYDLKSDLNAQGKWLNEVERRLNLPENKDKFVTTTFERYEDRIEITIEDEGDGFDWKKYKKTDPSRLLDSHGRGILMAQTLSFDELLYSDKGNKVTCIIKT
jgi:anti-sigma regulatory factor (Ser/Thr protein kinase)/CheY-like chemotaxis protein